MKGQTWRRYSIECTVTSEAEERKAEALFNAFLSLLRANDLTATYRNDPISGHRNQAQHGRTRR